jgi:starch-binding outer membrane protein, SusD/RagB family
MRTLRTRCAVGMLLLAGVGCGGDGPTTPEPPDADEVRELISTSFRAWYRGEHSSLGPTQMLSTMAFQHSATAGDFGAAYSGIPRAALTNASGNQYYGNLEWAWTQDYLALSMASRGIAGLAIPEVATALGADGVTRLRVVGKLSQALAMADVALLYDRGYAVDETMSFDNDGDVVLSGAPVTYQQLMQTALARFDEAIALANAAPPGLTVPAAWLATPADLTMPEIRRIAFTFKAFYRAAVARTPAERAAVNWGAVIADLDAGITAPVMQDMAVAGATWLQNDNGFVVAFEPLLQQDVYFMHGMADQSGRYQQWLALPVASRAPNFPVGGAPVLIVTPDQRFPQGATLAAQMAAAGRAFGIRANPSLQFTRPENGTWRWSQYSLRGLDASNGGRTGLFPLLTTGERRMLAAEGYFRTGNLQRSADSINVSRVFNGLNATNSAGLNTSCVPKLPNGSCGNLFEMLKWEKRMESLQRGFFGAGAFFDGRGWGDLYRGTPLQLPIPARQMSQLGLGAAYTFGGPGGMSSAPGSTYNFSGE